MDEVEAHFPERKKEDKEIKTRFGIPAGKGETG
jgi:hypothetical protein